MQVIILRFNSYKSQKINCFGEIRETNWLTWELQRRYATLPQGIGIWHRAVAWEKIAAQNLYYHSNRIRDAHDRWGALRVIPKMLVPKMTGS